VADQYGYVHCFWTETLFENEQVIIQYARFDGGTWSAPNDIYLSPFGVENLSADVDRQGTLHLVWAAGLGGPVYYTHAPASNALSVQSWAQPIRISIPAGIVQFRVDSKGVFHILYINRTNELGVYYVRSADQGETWSQPLWLDPDILAGYTPESLNFELDDNDGLHAVWFYGALEQGAKPDLVRYAHSLDGSLTWSAPFLIDKYVEETEHNLTVANPRMIVQGQTVHVIWAAGELPYRFHRVSTDAGETWSMPRPIFGELHGQAGDSLAVDGAGRIHFLSQVRYPVAIYEASWDQEHWMSPSLVYLIALEDIEEDAEGGFGDRVHAHLLQAVVRAGNQLVLTFGDGPADPDRRLFVMHRTLDDIAPLETIPTPTPTATQIQPSSPTPERSEPTPSPTATAVLMAGGQPLEEATRADLALQVGMVPVLLLLGGTLLLRLWYKNKS
jgi:hypothetical protein